MIIGGWKNMKAKSLLFDAYCWRMKKSHKCINEPLLFLNTISLGFGGESEGGGGEGLGKGV